MKNIIENIAALVKVKSLVTFCILAVWMALALAGKIEPTNVTNIALMVISFYFGTQAEKGGTK